MEVRRRPVESVGAAAGDVDTPPPVDRDPENRNVGNSLVEEGHRLYAEAEKSGFRNTDDLTNALRCFLRAVVLERSEAEDWITSFLESTPALPPSAVAAVPPSLLRLLQWVSTATTEQREVCLVAEGMFRRMTRGDRVIPRSGVEGAVANLLSSSDGSEHSPQLVKSAKGLRMSVKRMLCSALESSQSEEVTVDMFCEAAVTYARGVLPHDDGALSPQQQLEFRDANILKKVTKFPVQTAHFYKRSVLKLIERRGVKWIWSSFPTKQFYLLALAYFLPMISPAFILSSVATVVFVAGFVAMCVGTLQIVLAAEKVSSLVENSSIFQYFSEGGRKIDTRRPEAILVRRSVLPCAMFAASFSVTLLTFYLSHRSVVPSEVVCIVSAFCTLAVFLQFECYKSTLFLACSSTRLLSWFYAFLVVFQDALPIPDFLLYTGSASISLPIPGLHLRVNVVTLVQLPVQCLLIGYLLARNRWRNLYSGLGPYLLFTSWWVLTRHFFVLSSPLYLFLGTFGVVFILAVSPFLPLMLVASPPLVLFYYGLSGVFFGYVGIIVCFVALLLFLGRFSRQLMEAKWLNISFDSLVLLQILVSVAAILVGASLVTRYFTPTNIPTVTLAQYGEYCGPQNWAGGGGNMVQTQLDCLHLRDRVLSAGGLVRGVKIKEVSNDRELGLQSLLSVVRAALTCLLGRQEPMCGRRIDMETCRREFTSCHFQHSHKFTFAVGVNLTLPVRDRGRISVELLASNSFEEAVSRLSVGQEIRFNSTMVSGMGSDQLVLQLVSLEGFTSSRDREMENVEDSLQLLAYQVMQSVANTLAVLFDVLLGYTPPLSEQNDVMM